MTPVYFEPVGIDTEVSGPEDDSMMYEEGLESIGLHSWVTPDQAPTVQSMSLENLAAKMNRDEAEEFRTSDEIANDLAFSFDHIEDLLRG